MYSGSSISLRGRDGQYLCVHGSAVSAQVADGAGLTQSLQIELVGTEAVHGRGVILGGAPALIQHGDVVCLRASMGNLLQLLPPMLHDQTLLQVSASAARHTDAQHWEVLLM